MDEKNIQTLMKKVPELVSPNQVYDLALEKLDVEKMAAEKNLTSTDIGWNFAYVGFLTGVEWALRNIEAHEDEEDK